MAGRAAYVSLPKRITEPPTRPFPSKRRMLNQPKQVVGNEEASKPVPGHSVRAKREPSLTPPPPPALRTSGTIRIELPRSCHKMQPGWRERREKWVAEETGKLKALGLKVSKRLIREDGLALDWVSKVPVSPLTLQPPSHHFEPGVANSASSENPLSQSDLQADSAVLPSVESNTTGSNVFSTTVGLDDLPAIHDRLGVTQAHGLGFLEHYLRLFDSDRDALVQAYTPNATFSLTEERTVLLQRGTSNQSRQLVRTSPAAIVDALKTIGPHLHHSPLADITYNIATLDDMSPGGLLLTCEGALVPVHHLGHQEELHWSFSRIFVLKKNIGDSSQTWPLLAAAERLVIQRRAK